MSGVRCLAALGLVTLGGCSVPSLEELQAGRGITITVNYTPSFKTGCIEIETVDVADPSRVTTETIDGGTLATEVSPLSVRLLRRAGWSSRMQATVRAYEMSCTGKLVDEATILVDQGKTGQQSTLSVTLNSPDEDGDGYVAILGGGKGGTDCNDNGNQRGAEMFPGNLEVCDIVDNNCNGQVDEGLDTRWYLDEDGDGVPRGPDFISSCTAPSAKHMRYEEWLPFDCKDTGSDAAKMFPGNPELCDNIDNDCSGVVDNGFEALGEACNFECGGVSVCSGDGLSVVCNRAPGRYYYPDRDGDGQGAVGSTATLKCGIEPADPGTVANDDDCDDADPASREGLTEVCDAIDNNCDGVVDNATPACGGTLKRVENNHHLTSDNQDWKTVATGPSGYPVWVAGRGGKLALRRSANERFESFSFGDPTSGIPSGNLPVNNNNCGDHNWTQAWVNPDGVVFLGGESGWLGIHTGAIGTANYTCQPGATPGASHITGMVGFVNGGTTTIYLGDTSGRLYRWLPSAPVAERFTELNNSDFVYHGLHALTPEFVLAVGGTTPGTVSQRFFSFDVQAQSPTSTPIEHTTNPNNVNGNVRSVWMGSATSACAVGDNAAVWRWDGATTWNKVDGPVGVTGTFTSVVMRNDTQSVLAGQCYIVSGNGGSQSKVHRLTQYGWAKPLDLLPTASANVALNDIAITPNGEIWVVGEDGRVFHYPEP